MLPVISLIEHVGLGLIVECPSGVVYSNQTGGTSCLHPGVEGIFVPLRNDCLEETRELLSAEHVLFAYFEGPKWRGTGAVNGIDPEDAEFISSVLSEKRLSHCITVDHSRLRESHEAWIHVSVTAEESSSTPIFSGFAPYPRPGILTWTNTD